ncbi:hypothetical protein ACQ4PT_062282 [Festuca glaucescens]
MTLWASAPGLTELSLIDVGTTHFQAGADIYMCYIRAPNLRVLNLVMFSENGCRLAGDFPLLEKAVISIHCRLLETEEFVQSFRLISSVKSLSFHIDSNKVDEDPLEEISWKYQNLKVGSLSANFGKLSSIKSIFSLLRCAPHIEKLEIEVISGVLTDDKIDEDILNEKASDGLFASLKHVSVTGIKYFMPNEICFMKFLLSKTGSLESFVATFCFKEVKDNACTKLATWRKASPQAKISLRLLNELAPHPDES